MSKTQSISASDSIKTAGGATKNGKSLREPDYCPTYSKHYETLDLKPADVFPRVIQRDRSLCSNCYADRYDYRAVEFWCGSLGWLLWERPFPIAGRNDPDPPKDERHDGRPICCTSCGFESGRRKGELPKPEAMAIAENISQALTRRGYDHDREILLRAVWKHKGEPGRQGQRGKVFGDAVAEAVRYARYTHRE